MHFTEFKETARDQDQVYPTGYGFSGEAAKNVKKAREDP